MKKVVVSLHGIRTRGVWQKDLVPVLANNGFTPHPLDYGNFPATFLLFPPFRSKKVEWLLRECERIMNAEHVSRISIIAHSFGSFMVAEMLSKYHAIKVDKVIFAGSIVKKDFDIAGILNRGQINLVENNYGENDIWPKVAKKIVMGAGDAGARGFNDSHPLLIQKEFKKHGHSEYFHYSHFTKHWIPTLRRIVVNAHDRLKLTNIMNLVAKTAASRLKVNLSNIRANIFTEDHDSPENISIPCGLHYNMSDENELTVSMAIDTGCAGKSFGARTQVIAILKQGWGEHEVPDGESVKLDPNLRWIISTPIPDPDDRGGIIGVMSIDGLVDVKEKEELEVLLEDLRMSAQALGQVFSNI